VADRLGLGPVCRWTVWGWDVALDDRRAQVCSVRGAVWLDCRCGRQAWAWACLQMDGLGLGCRFGRQLLPEWTSVGISLSLGVVLEDRFCGSISAEGQLCFRVSS
jgi:hypothetical protein